jgi:hypothetical protein
LDVDKDLFPAVIGCVDGEYQTLADYPPLGGANCSPQIVYIGDMKLNSTPDIVFAFLMGSGWNFGADIQEWNGSEFVSLIQASHGEKSASASRTARILFWYGIDGFFIPVPYMNGVASYDIRDLDGNGTIELILKDFGPAHHDTLYSFGPWRGKRVVFSWDGLHVICNALEMDPPMYRFQAVQDADRFFLMGDYARAERLYRAVFTSKPLERWTSERMRFLLDQQWAEAAGRHTPVPPAEDEDGYPRLSAYAGYRLVLLKATRGDMPSAEGLYVGLLSSHPSGSVGYPYVLLAARFLGNFRVTHDPVKACARVLDYAESIAGLLEPLGDMEHGAQSHIYETVDLCPFP